MSCFKANVKVIFLFCRVHVTRKVLRNKVAALAFKIDLKSIKKKEVGRITNPKKSFIEITKNVFHSPTCIAHSVTYNSKMEQFMATNRDSQTLKIYDNEGFYAKTIDLSYLNITPFNISININESTDELFLNNYEIPTIFVINCSNYEFLRTLNTRRNFSLLFVDSKSSLLFACTDDVNDGISLLDCNEGVVVGNIDVNNSYVFCIKQANEYLVLSTLCGFLIMDKSNYKILRIIENLNIDSTCFDIVENKFILTVDKEHKYKERNIMLNLLDLNGDLISKKVLLPVAQPAKDIYFLENRIFLNNIALPFQCIRLLYFIEVF